VTDSLIPFGPVVVPGPCGTLESTWATPTPPRTKTLDPPPELTDLGNARRLVRRFGSDLRFVSEWGKWLVWEGGRWTLDITGETERAAKSVAEAIVEEGRLCHKRAKSDDERRDARELTVFGLRSQSSGRLRAMVTVASTEPDIPVLVDQLDADPWKLVVGNGTLDLRTGELHASERGDFLTRQTDVPWDADAACPTFDAFLERILPDDEVRAFVQRAVGYSLTGLSTEHVLFICYGGGANGKSTLMEVVLRLLDEHAAPAPPHLLVAEKYSQHPTAIADPARPWHAVRTADGGRSSRARNRPPRRGSAGSACDLGRPGRRPSTRPRQPTA
jgi:putative DNA primase/helicase